MKQSLTDRLNPTAEQKAQMLRRIREKYGTTPAARPRSKHWRTALACAAVCALIGTSAFAAISMGLADGLRDFLHPATPEQEELLAQGAYVVNRKDSNKNGTLAVKQVVGDSNLVYLLLEFTAPEGTVLDQDGYRFSGELKAGQQTTGSGFVKMEDDDASDNQITLVMSEPTRQPVAGKRAVLELYDLEGADMGEAYETVVPGSWSVSFPLDFADCSVTYTIDQTVPVQGYDVTLQSISVSPLSIAIHATSPYTRQISSALDARYAPYSDDSPRWFPITIQYADGTSETAPNTATGRMGSMSEMNHLSGDIFDVITFSDLINTKEIRSIEFCGTEILLTQD